MAGMPVGPLSLSRGRAPIWVLKIMKATEADLAPTPSTRPRRSFWSRWSKKAVGSPRTARGFLRLSREGQGPEEPVAGLSGLQPKHLDPDTLDVEELKQRFFGGAGGGSRAHVEDHVITDPARPMFGSILGFGFGAVDRRHAVLHRLHGHQEVRGALPQA